MIRQRLLWALLGLQACKRPQAPAVPEVWNEVASAGRTREVSDLAPSWGSPTRAILDDGLLVHWLHEPAAPHFRLRVVLPLRTPPGAEPSSAAQSLVSILLRQHAERELRGLNTGVALEPGAGRIELVVTAPADHGRTVLEALGRVLGRVPPGPVLARALEPGAALPVASTDDLAIAVLVARLLGTPELAEIVLPGSHASLSRADLERVWLALVDPRSAILVVHGPEPATALRGALRTLSGSWRGVDRRPVPTTALERLRGPSTSTPPKGGRLGASPETPLALLERPDLVGPEVLYLGRILPTPTTESAASARLAQRILQEAVDARLVPLGSRTLLLVRVPIGGRDGAKAVHQTLATMSELSGVRQPQRLFQAARLWLGARVVQSSLAGEDWTRLWSEALDLGERDEDIENALAANAAAMMSTTPEALSAWQTRFMDPLRGEPGWLWVAAGRQRQPLRELARALAKRR